MSVFGEDRYLINFRVRKLSYIISILYYVEHFSIINKFIVGYWNNNKTNNVFQNLQDLAYEGKFCDTNYMTALHFVCGCAARGEIIQTILTKMESEVFINVCIFVSSDSSSR